MIDPFVFKMEKINMASIRELWLHNLQTIRKEYPFGPLKLIKNPQGQLHCETGPAYISTTSCIWYLNGQRHGRYIDIWGTVLYYFRNVLIPKHYAEEPWNLEIEEIIKNPNAEVRCAGLEIYGWERLSKEKLLKRINTDKETGAELYHGMFGDQPICLVKVINSTPDQDGKRKAYFLQVPPDTKTCKQAIAWTFRVDAKDYHPDLET